MREEMPPPRLAPLGAVVHEPVREGSLEADIMAGAFGEEPFVLEDLFAFLLELGVEVRPLQEVHSFAGGLFLAELGNHN